MDQAGGFSAITMDVVPGSWLHKGKKKRKAGKGCCSCSCFWGFVCFFLICFLGPSSGAAEMKEDDSDDSDEIVFEMKEDDSGGGE